MGNIWRKMRMKTGLTISDVANYIDVDYKKYEAIDRGIVKMPSRYIDKFNELIKRSKGENKIQQLNREEVVNEWWASMCERKGRGVFGLSEKMREFNIDNMSDLDRLLGYSSSGATSNYLNKGVNIGYDLKNKYYSFFENELNIQPPKVVKTISNPKNKLKISYSGDEEYSKLLEWFENTDIKQWAMDRGLSRDDVRDGSGLSDGTVNNLYVKHHSTPYMSTLRKLKNYVDNYKTDITTTTAPAYQTMTFKSIPAEEVPEDIRKIDSGLVREVNDDMKLRDKLLDKYEHEIETLTVMIEQHEAMLFDLRKEKDFYEKIINDISED